MVLVACPDCQTAISDQAPACVKCGRPMKVTTPTGTARTVVVNSGGNAIAAIASFFIPGLGQLSQGRVLSALAAFIGTVLLWTFTLGLLGWLGHIIAAFEAAAWRDPEVGRVRSD